MRGWTASLAVFLWSAPVWGQGLVVDPPTDSAPDIDFAWVVLLAAGPLLAIMATAFAKAAVLLGILRGGLGPSSVLPTPVVLGFATILTLLVMAPISRDVNAAIGPNLDVNTGDLVSASSTAWPILERFLITHTKPADAATVGDALKALDPDPDLRTRPAARIVAFSLTELTTAFHLGVLLLIPFLVVDLLVANTLAILGFHLLSPILVALPFKLLLFVAADGWTLFVRGFMGTYS